MASVTCIFTKASLVTVRLPAHYRSRVERLRERKQDCSRALGLYQLGDLSRSRPGRSRLRFRPGPPGPRACDLQAKRTPRPGRSWGWREGRGRGAGETRSGEPSTRYFWAEPPSVQSDREPGSRPPRYPPARACLPLPSGNQPAVPAAAARAARRERAQARGAARAGASGLAPRPPRSASRRAVPRPPSGPARGAGEAPEAPSRRARAEPDGPAGAGAAGRELLIRTSLADSLRPTMHRGGQPLKKRRGSFKMAELDQLPDESK